MPTDWQFKAMNTFHQGVLKISGGRLGWRAGGMPVVELTTTGRKSGQPRTVILTSPLQEGDSIVVVGSRGGDDRDPDWVLNVQQNRDVDVKFAGKPKQRMRARVTTPEERASLWPRVTASYKGYGNYQTKTDREIPLVLLEPPTR